MDKIGSPGGGDTPVRISVVIPSFNSRHTIAKGLQALRRQAGAPPFEVILVDSSTDGTAALVEREFPEVTVLSLPRKTYQARARNLGAEMTRGDILAFLDADCIPRPDWAAAIAASFGQAEVRATAGPLENANPRSAVSRAMFLLQFRETLLCQGKDWVDNLPANNIAYDKESFLAHGGFPETMGSSEETLLHVKLQESGIGIRFNPQMRVAHWNLENWRPYLAHQVKQGRFYRIARRQAVLRGSRVLDMLLPTPFFPFYRFFRNLPLVFRQTPGFLAALITCFPLFLGLVFYSIGEVLGHLAFRSHRKSTSGTGGEE